MSKTPTRRHQPAFLNGCSKFFESLEGRTLLAQTWNPVDGTALRNILNLTATQGGLPLQLGDTINLNAGTTYTGHQFTLPNLTAGSGYVTIQSSQVSKLTPGSRVTPDDAKYMARIQAPGGNASAIRTPNSPAQPSHHFKMIGLEIVGPANNSSLTALVELGTSSSSQDTLAETANNIIIDRCYMRPNTPTASIRRAIALNSASTDIINSWIEEIHQAGSDSQAIGGWNGAGPFNIINNRLEGASENIMFGGDTTSLTGIVATDVVIRGNHVIKPLHWMGKGYNTKNLFELKHGKNFMVENNIFENCWVDGQDGKAIVLKLGNLEQSNWNITENITLRNNIIRNASGGVSLQGRDYDAKFPNQEPMDPGGLVRDLKFFNNLFLNMSFGGDFGTTPWLSIVHGPKDVTFDHNTVINGDTTIYVDTPEDGLPPDTETRGFVFTNNLAYHNTYGVRGAGSANDDNGSGNEMFWDPNLNGGEYFSDVDHTFTGNILVGGNANNYTDRPGNFFPANTNAVGFVDTANLNYRLAPSSIYNNAGTDGQDIGANIDQLELAVTGVASGVFRGATGTGGVGLDDKFVLRRVIGGRRFSVANSPPLPAGTAPITDVLAWYQGLHFWSGDGDDRLTVEYANGSPLPVGTTSEGSAMRGIFYDGGAAAASDTLVITGNGASATYAPNGATVSPSDFNAKDNRFTLAGDMTFAAVEGVSATNLAGLTLITANATDNLNIDTVLSKWRVNGNSGGTIFPAIDATNSIPLTLDLATNDGGSGNDAVTVAAGSATIGTVNLNAGTGSNSFTANGGTTTLNTNVGIGGANVDLNVNNAGTNVNLPGSQSVKNIVIGSGGKASLVAGTGSTLRASSVAITGAGSQLNLADNDMIIDYTGSSPLGAGVTYTGVSGLLRDGRNGGAWNGAGIVTSMTAAQSPSMLTTLGVGEAKDVLNLAIGQTGTWNGQSVDETALLIKYTYLGDANLSGGIDGDDYVQIDAGYSGNLKGYYNGDFDYSQKVDADDYFGIDSNYNKDTPALIEAAPPAVVSAEELEAPIVVLATASQSANVAPELPTLPQTPQSSKKSLLDELV